MKKTLISLAVAGAFIAPSVMAEVTTYGLVQAELSKKSWKEEDTTLATPRVNTLDLVDNANGRLGVKASEDLGNGWKGLAKLEFSIDTVDNDISKNTCTATSTSTTTITGGNVGETAATTTSTKCTVSNTISLGGRETMVGLKGSAGQFEAGVLQQPSKYFGGVKYDAFVATTLEARGNGGMLKNEYGEGSFHFAGLGYENSFGPVKVRVTFSPQTDDGTTNLGVMYEANGIEAFITSAHDEKTTDDKTSTYKTSKIGGAYSMGPHKVMLQLENAKSDPGTNLGTKADEATTDKYTYLAYHGKFGKTMFIFQYGKFTDDDAADTAKYKSHNQTYMAIGAQFQFSKETYLFGGYKSTKADDFDPAVANSDTQSNNVISVGMTKKF